MLPKKAATSTHKFREKMNNKTHDEMVDLNFQAIKEVKQLRKEVEENNMLCKGRSRSQQNPLYMETGEFVPGMTRSVFDGLPPA